jgi:hypothetical protein
MQSEWIHQSSGPSLWVPGSFHPPVGCQKIPAKPATIGTGELDVRLNVPWQTLIYQSRYFDIDSILFLDILMSPLKHHDSRYWLLVENLVQPFVQIF